LITAAALLAWLAILLLPGTAIIRLLGLRGSFLGSVAMAAPVSFGFIYLVGLAATQLHAPMLANCLIFLGVLVASWLVVEFVRLRRAAPWTRWGRPAGRPPGYADPAPSAAARFRSLFPARSRAVTCSRALLILAIGVGIALWTTLHSHLLVPAGWDAMHHGYFVQQILRHDTLSAKVVLSSNPSQADSTTNFYPLAANLVTALLHLITGVGISTLILTGVTALAGVILPLGVYFLSLRFAPQAAPVAGFAALASLLPAGLFTIEYTGRVTAIMGIALVPAAVTVIGIVRDKIDPRVIVLGALALVGIVGTHTSELPIVVGLVIVLVAQDAVYARQWRPSVFWLVEFVGAGILGALLVLGAEPGILHLIGERAGSLGAAAGGHMELTQAFRQFILLPSPFPPQTTHPMHVWSVLAAVGCLLTVLPRWRRLAGAAIGYVGFGAFYIAWLTGKVGPLAIFADAWYRNSNRIMWELFGLGAIPVGVTLAAAATLIHDAIRLTTSVFARTSATEAGVVVHASGPTTADDANMPKPVARPSRRNVRSGLQWTSAIIAGIAVFAGTMATAAPPARTVSTWLRANASPVSEDSLASFRYLAAHVHGNQRVLDDLESHGDLWMYAEYGVPTMLGNPPLIGLAPDSWKQRLYIRGELTHIATNGCVADLLAKYDITYVYYSGERMFGGKPRLRLTTLQDPRFFQEVFAQGDTSVFKIRPPATPRPCDTDLTDTAFPWSTTANSN
jgi:hypothetical protein